MSASVHRHAFGRVGLGSPATQLMRAVSPPKGYCVTMKLKVLYPTSQSLQTSHRPDVALRWIVRAFLVAVAAWTITSGNAREYWYLVVPGLLYPLEFVFERAITGEFDAQTGRLTISKSGLLGTGLLASRTVVPVAEISHLEMKRHIAMYGGDRFQIRVQMRNGERFDLSRPTMWFDDCQTNAEEISRFMGLPIGPRASA